MTQAYIDGVGAVDEHADVWALFAADARGAYGLYAGQLVAELAQKLPALRARLVEVVQRGLGSDDADERAAALAGAYQLRGALDAAAALVALAERHPEEARARVFLDVLASQRGSEEAARLAAQLWAQPLAGEARAALARARASLDARAAGEALGAALDEGDDARAQPLVDALAATPAFADVVARLRGASVEARARLVTLAYAALAADRTPYGYDRWLEMAQTIDAAPNPPPERPEESERAQAFGARLGALVDEEARGGAAAAPAPTTVVLTPEVWVDLLRSPDGPPAQLVARLRQRGVSVLASEPLIAAVLAGLAALGWDDGRRGAADAQLRALASLRAGADDLALARAAGLDRVYGVGARAAAGGRDGVAVRPVHELLQLLG